MSKLYYTPPTDNQFNELQSKAREVWFEMDSEHSYLQEKVSKVDGLQNVGDNFMYMVAMFDGNNQRKLANKLSEPTRIAVRERMIDGGAPEYTIVF